MEGVQPGLGEPLEQACTADLALGSSVRLNSSLPYLKTAEPMPMLRPPDLIDPGETGVVVELRALGVRAVRFRRGTFLIEGNRLAPVLPHTAPTD